MRIASRLFLDFGAERGLCLSTSHTDCIATVQHLIGLARVLCLSTSHADCIPAAEKDLFGVLHFASARPMRIASCARCGWPCAAAFASARPMRIASMVGDEMRRVKELCLSTSHADCIPPWWNYVKSIIRLCLSTSHADCILDPAQQRPNPQALPQHVPCGLHPDGFRFHV